jgi:hypothetical protein
MRCHPSREDVGERGARASFLGKDRVAGWIPAGGSTSKGNQPVRGLGAAACHRGVIRGHGCWVMGGWGNLSWGLHQALLLVRGSIPCRGGRPVSIRTTRCQGRGFGSAHAHGAASPPIMDADWLWRTDSGRWRDGQRMGKPTSIRNASPAGPCGRARGRWRRDRHLRTGLRARVRRPPGLPVGPLRRRRQHPPDRGRARCSRLAGAGDPVATAGAAGAPPAAAGSPAAALYRAADRRPGGRAGLRRRTRVSGRPGVQLGVAACGGGRRWLVEEPARRGCDPDRRSDGRGAARRRAATAPRKAGSWRSCPC